MTRILLALVVAAAALFSQRLVASQAPGAAAAVPEVVSEIIFLKYALATEVAAALDGLRTGSKTATGSRFKERLQSSLDAAALDCEIEGLGERRIISDERSNSLLVNATPSDLARIKGIIAKLDVMRPQILIEAVIFERPLTNLKSPGRAEARSGGAATNPRAPTNLSMFSSRRFVSGVAANGPGLHGNELSCAVTLSGNLDAVVNALATNNDVKILQRPRIQTSDGERAILFLRPRQTYPIDVGSGWCGCVPSLRLSETGATIEVTCFLTTDGLVLTDIQQQRWTGSVTKTGAANVPVAASKNSLAQIAIHDGEIIALGGLIETVERPIFSEIALLDRVPQVGELLNRLITYPTRKTPCELVVLIRPMVLPVPQD